MAGARVRKFTLLARVQLQGSLTFSGDWSSRDSRSIHPYENAKGNLYGREEHIKKRVIIALQ